MRINFRNSKKNTSGSKKYNKMLLSVSHVFNFLSPKAVDITSCGNFAVIGLSSGAVDVYNMQSGLHRGSFGKDQGIEILFLFFCFLLGLLFGSKSVSERKKLRALRELPPAG